MSLHNILSTMTKRIWRSAKLMIAAFFGAFIISIASLFWGNFGTYDPSMFAELTTKDTHAWRHLYEYTGASRVIVRIEDLTLFTRERSQEDYFLDSMKAEAIFADWSRFALRSKTLEGVFKLPLTTMFEARGLPFRSFWCSYTFNSKTQLWQTDLSQGGIPLGNLATIPFNIYWPGLLLNMVVFIVLIKSWRIAQYASRRWRGDCLSCGYSLQMLQSNRCPECGWNRLKNKENETVGLL